ncbi:MAG: hypothetical protein ACT4N5_05705 [Nitrosopumilaceae archaeon]
MPKKYDSKWWIYDQTHESLDSLVGFLESMLSSNKKYQIAMFLLVSKKDIFELFSSKNSYHFYTDFGNSNKNNSMLSFRITKKDEKKIKPDISGNVLFARTPKSEVYLAITDEPRDFVQFVLTPFLKSYYPYISKAFLSANELRQILERLESVTGGQIIADRITAHRRISYIPMQRDESGSKENRIETKESHRVWTKRPFRDAFNEAILNDEWIDKVEFRLINDSKTQMEAYFSRHGLFKFRDSISPFYQTLLPFIMEIIERKFNLYSHRSRNEKPKPSPLVIELDSDIFKDDAQNHRFIEIMKKMSYISMSVYHNNPYIHVSLVDYLDGSTFDLWVLSTNKITVVPQLRATEASVARLMNHIFERFREGTVKEYEGYVKTT